MIYSFVFDFQCSATCGSSVKTRDVVCMKKLGEELFAIVDEENCQGKRRPATEELCPELEPCPAEWFNTKWTEVINGSVSE